MMSISPGIRSVVSRQKRIVCRPGKFERESAYEVIEVVMIVRTMQAAVIPIVFAKARGRLAEFQMSA